MHSLRTKYLAILHYTTILQSLRRVASMYKVSKSSLSRWVNEKDVLKRTRKVKQPCKTINKIDKAVASMVKANPFITMDAIGQKLGLDFGLKRSASSVFRSMRRNRISRKRVKQQITSPKQLPENYNYSNLRNALSKPSTISIDEAGFYVTEYPRYGYALKGTKVIRKISHKVLSPARKVSLVLAIDQGRVIAWKINDRAFNRNSFREFIQNDLAPKIQAGSSIVMDNIAFHRNDAVKKAIQSAGMKAVYIPPYSPDFNPIEEVFSWLKRRLRASGDYLDIKLLKDKLHTLCSQDLAAHSSHFPNYFNASVKAVDDVLRP
jgi:transposase